MVSMTVLCFTKATSPAPFTRHLQETRLSQANLLLQQVLEPSLAVAMLQL